MEQEARKDEVVEVVDGKRFLRKIDLRLIPYLSLLYMFSFLDRVNIGHARMYGLEKALNLTQTEYSWTLSIFFVGYIIFEIPSNLMMKRMSPPIWISRIMVTWGIVTICMAAVAGFKGLMISRFFLGLCEAGLFPGLIFYLGFWYTRQDQGTRIAFFFSASSLAGAFGGIISYVINTIDGEYGLSGWQWIFVLEGVPTVLLGLTTWKLMPDTPQKAEWLTASERDFLTRRLVESHVELNGKRFDREQFISSFTDLQTYLYMVCYIGMMCPMYSLALLMPTIVNAMGFERVISTLMTVPPYTIAFFTTIFLGWNSDRLMDRGFHIMFSATVGLVGFTLLLVCDSIYIRYASVNIAVIGAAGCIPLVPSWMNNNTQGSTKSATSSAFIIAFGNIGGVIAGQFYRAEEAPRYVTSNIANISFLVLTIVTVITLKLVLVRENKRLDCLVQDDRIPDHTKSDQETSPAFRYIL